MDKQLALCVEWEHMRVRGDEENGGSDGGPLSVRPSIARGINQQLRAIVVTEGRGGAGPPRPVLLRRMVGAWADGG